MQGSDVTISGNQFRNFGQFADLPEKLQPAMESGLSFFEIRFQGEKRFNMNVFGFYDVIVERNMEMVRRSSVRYNVDWRTGRDAKITFKCENQKTGLSIAFMVDDPFWHNRMMMAFNPVYMIFALHTREGQIPGSIVSGEIECMREICMEKAIQYVAINPLNRTLCADYDESVVEDFIQSKQKGNRRPVRLRKLKRNAYITRPEIIQIIHDNDRNQFGWTNSEAFNKKIKEPTLALIERRGISRTIEPRQSVTQGQIQDMVAQAIRSMTPEQIRTMISSTTSTVPVGPANKVLAKESGFSAPKPPEFKNKTFFLRMKYPDAKEEAARRGMLGFDGVPRRKLLNALIIDEDNRKAKWDSEQKLAPGVSAPVPGEKIDPGEDMTAG